MKRYMFIPRREEVEYYGQFMFCDDLTDGDRMSLASAEQIEQLKDYSIIRRIVGRLRGGSMCKGKGELFWPCGTAAFLPLCKNLWYRFNIFVWEWIKYAIKRNR